MKHRNGTILILIVEVTFRCWLLSTNLFFDLYFKDKLTFSLEEWDTILNYYRPNGSSKTWYLQEEGKIDIPKMWGHWNIVNTEGDNKMFDPSIAKEQVTPSFYYDYAEFVTKKDLENKKHIYLINVYDPNFFIRNIDIGFGCISEKYKKDIIEKNQMRKMVAP